MYNHKVRYESLKAQGIKKKKKKSKQLRGLFFSGIKKPWGIEDKVATVVPLQHWASSIFCSIIHIMYEGW